MIAPHDVIEFWTEAGEDRWYAKSDAFDAEIRARFLSVWEGAAIGAGLGWMDNPEGALALILVTDQFPRNMFRDDPRAFVTDPLAQAASGRMIVEGWDRDVAEPMRQFCYVPWMHSEAAADQAWAVTLFTERMETGNNHLHARVHQEIIHRFGRFPYRNVALGRPSSPEEQAFLSEGGYAAILKEMEAAGA